MAANLRSLEILDQFDFYRAAGPDLRAEIARSVRRAKLEEGAYFFHAGQECGGIPLVAKGDVRVFLSGESGREITLYHVEAGQTCLLTLNAALQNTPYTADARVEEALEALIVPVAIFQRWFHDHDAIRQFVLDVMARRITELMMLVSEITFGRLDHRLGEYLIRQFHATGADIQVLSVTHEHIAAELGSAREVISRVLKEFERMGALRIRRGRIELKDLAVIERLAAD